MDAIKEMGIRLRDTEASGEALTQLGFNAEEMGARFASGGKDASDAFSQIFVALSNVKDETERNKLATEIFGI